MTRGSSKTRNKGTERKGTARTAETTATQEVKVVSRDGAIITDGVLQTLDTGKRPKVVFSDGKQRELCEGMLVVEQIDTNTLHGLPEGTPVLLVDQWACGGRYMRRGRYSHSLSGTLVCLEGDRDPLNVQRYAEGSFKVLWGI